MIVRFIFAFLCIISFFNNCSAEELSSSVIIRGIKFKGNYHISAQEILKKVPLSLRYGDFLSKEKIEDDLKALFRIGIFYDAWVSFEKTYSGTKIIFNLKENPLIDEIRFLGIEAFTEEKIKEKMELKKGVLLDYNLLEKDIKAIESFYKEKGYEYSGVASVFFDAKSRELVITLNEVKVEEIKIIGNTKTQDIILLREMETRSGRLLNLKILSDDRERIFALGMFSEVKTPYILEGSKPGLAKVVVEVTETKTSTINGGFGYSQIDNWIVYGSFVLGNIRGIGESFYLKGQLSQNRNTYELKYVRPWTFFPRVSLSIDKWFIERDEDYSYAGSSGEQKVKKDGLSFTFSRPISNVLTSSVRLESEDVIPSVTGSYLKRSFRFLVSYDSRDNWLDTKKGTFASVSIEQAFKSLGSTIEYSRYDSDLYYFTPFRDRATIAFRITAGILKPILESGVYLPVSENYQVGGSTTVRGYPDTTPFAVGQRQILGSIEFRQNLSQLIGVVLFFDYGTAFESRIELSDIKIGKGAGLRINTPMGPIRGDFGWGEAGLMVFHFTLGQAF